MDPNAQPTLIEEESKTAEPAAPVEAVKKQVKTRRPRNSVNAQPKYTSILSTSLRGEKLIAHAACKRFGERCVSTSEGIAMNALAGNLQSMMIEGEIIVTENKAGGINVAFNGFKTNYSKIPDQAFLCIRNAIAEHMAGSSLHVSVPVSTESSAVVAQTPAETPVRPKKRARTQPIKRQFAGKGDAIAFRLSSEQGEEDEEESVKPPGESDSDSSSSDSDSDLSEDA